MELDDKNKIIFENLLSNGRSSLKDLAKLLKMTKAAVMKRINYLESEGYIFRYDAIINWQKLPLIKKVYFLKVQDTYEFEKKIVLRREVFSVISLSGLYNYQVWCFFKDKKQLNEFERQIRIFQCLKFKVDNLTFPKVSFFDVSSKIPVRKSADIEINLKKIDLKIMQYMAQGHGRDSFFEISKSLNLPYDSVHYHGKRLLKAGYFQAVVAQPGTNLFTLQTTCLLIKCKDLSYSKALFDSLKRTRYVLSDAIGGNVIMVHFLSPDHKVYRESLSRILGLVGLENIKNVFVLHWDKVILNNRYPLEFLL